MRIRPLHWTLAFSAFLALACGKGGPQDSELDCGNALDDDADGFADCDDAECQADPACDDDDEDEEDCNNGDDDDGDDDVDCDDDDCDGDEDCESSEVEDCDNGDDDDGDGDIDCDDSDCEGKPVCDELPTEEFDCDNGVDDDDDGDTDCDDSDCSSDADCQSGDYFEPVYFNVTGGFAYNLSTNRVVRAFDDSGGAIPPFVQVIFIEEDYFDAADEQYLCSVSWVYDSTTALPLSIMTDLDGIKHGGFKLDLASDSAWSASTDCDLDPSVYGDPIEWVRDNFGQIGVGVGRTSVDVQTAIDDQVTAADAVYFGGAGLWLYDTYYNPNYAFGYEVDSSMNLVDGGVPILASDYDNTTGTPAHAYYQSSLLFVFNMP